MSDLNLRVFIGSSEEGLVHATHVVQLFHERVPKQPVIDPRIWKDVLPRGESVFTGLVDALERFDFAVFVLTKDDVLQIREEVTEAARDNVILEFGMFTGRLGIDRTFVIMPDDPTLKLPSDLEGQLVGKYPKENITASSFRPAINYARGQMLVKGPLRTNLDSTEPSWHSPASTPTSKPSVGRRLSGAERASQPSELRTNHLSERVEINREVFPDSPSWMDLLKGGVLTRADPDLLGFGTYVVHVTWGLAMVVEVGPETNFGRLVIVSFEPSRGEGEVRANDLYLTRIVGPNP